MTGQMLEVRYYLNTNMNKLPKKFHSITTKAASQMRGCFFNGQCSILRVSECRAELA